MSRTPVSLHVGDVSALARTMRRQLDNLERAPSHLELLNLLAKAGGYRNFQHLKAVQQASQPDSGASTATQTEAELNLKRVKKAVGYFDLNGRLSSWPKKHSLRMLCLWVLWSRLPARAVLSELELDERLSLDHAFCDHALLRRLMVDYGMVERTPDGSEYRRIEVQPPLEALEVFRRLH